ncbi:MAG TPA: hypothetical protein VFD71_14685 [Planctomycetota bacterium]|nr:hypothetical protein [Planctomycetota bacterium]
MRCRSVLGRLRGCVAALGLVLAVASVAAGGDEAGARVETRRAAGEDRRRLALEAFVRDTAASALAEVRAKYRLPSQLRVLWVLDAAAASSGVRTEAYELGSTAVEKGEAVVTLPARKYLRAPESSLSVIRHEAAHAALASALGSADLYRAVPRWFREGLAIVFSGEGELATAEAVALAVYEDRGASSFLLGIDSAQVSHAECYLAVAFLEERVGQDGFERIVAEVARGGDLAAAIEKLLGDRPDAFAARALESARRRVSALCPEARERRSRAALRLAASGDPASLARTAPELELLLAQDPAGPISGTCRYFLAKAVVEGRKDSWAVRALPALERISRSGGALWRAEALVLEGECLAELGRVAEARERWGEVEEVFGEDSRPVDRARRNLAATRVVQ